MTSVPFLASGLFGCCYGVDVHLGKTCRIRTSRRQRAGLGRRSTEPLPLGLYEESRRSLLLVPKVSKRNRCQRVRRNRQRSRPVGTRSEPSAGPAACAQHGRSLGEPHLHQHDPPPAGLRADLAPSMAGSIRGPSSRPRGRSADASRPKPTALVPADQPTPSPLRLPSSPASSP
jgi:hypothetical protein